MTPTLRLGLAIAAAVVVLDQATKAMALSGLAATAPVPVTGFLNLVLVWNTGVSFGMLADNAVVGPWLLAGFALAVAAALGVWLWRVGERRIAIALGLAIGGALSNVVDRLRWGAVIDFLDFHAFGWHWPAFNLADAAITIGVGGLVLASLMESRQKARLDRS
ncbi:MAG: signal peptidase II [Alphaproteobacteria bacterium]|nr:signal peptidase II [Alphaproteobacteria bacterium]MDP6517094.1 signal peptidase II [Alphaproteobacteria bacterium]